MTNLLSGSETEKNEDLQGLLVATVDIFLSLARVHRAHNHLDMTMVTSSLQAGYLETGHSRGRLCSVELNRIGRCDHSSDSTQLN